ncbi:hypothetical protein GCM10010140_11910 [Streptosporangium pseudovulgare]|uniref:Uncharacterized protein n=1 Tax=Streptosporangium pseudovulgare TaxID=35765 RepID=A0ABQ2QLB9_9ACTN|nr:hypothetical protein GCM10010140_11910 [Streptosporangium pseudovulgare]
MPIRPKADTKLRYKRSQKHSDPSCGLRLDPSPLSLRSRLRQEPGLSFVSDGMAMSVYRVWLRHGVAALLVLPLLCIVLLSFPAWVSWPFLAEDKRKTVLSFVRQLTQWAQAIGGVRN